MILKSLELQGFKSFPDKTVLNFGLGITVVVGPNGSGKSNISDAVRWVLGEQSSKSLRGGKMEDVVFGGTEKRKAVGFADVSLIIDNSNRMLDFDKDEVKITRRYFRSGDSEYLLNNVSVRLKDIQMLFMNTGLGRDGYSIIGQGKIADIVASKSHERREIFEEAAGIAKYRYQKNESERKLNATEANLLRLRDIVTELEERVGPLKIQSEKAKKFIELAERKKHLEISLWLYKLEEYKTAIRTLSSKLELAKTQYENAQTTSESLEEEISALVLKGQQLSVEMDNVRAQASSLENDAINFESEIAVFENDIFHNNENILRINNDIIQLNTSDKDFESEMKIRTLLLEQKKEDVWKKEQHAISLTETLSDLTKSSDNATDELDVLSAEATALAVLLSDLRVNIVASESAFDEIVLRTGEHSSETENRTTRKHQLKNQTEQCKEAFDKCAENVMSLKNSVKGYEMRFSSREKSCETAKQALDLIYFDSEELRRRIKVLSALEQSMEGFTQSVKAVMKQRDAGMLGGIYGPVSQLLETKSDTALAIETALGAAVQNIVCDTDQTAKQTINFLKTSKLGRATFLPISSIKSRSLDESGLENCIGFVGIASTLVSYNMKYDGIIKNLLARTVVVENLDDATSVAKKYSYRFRVVTLDGQVVNAGGSMTGGSHVRGAGLLSRRSEIDTLSLRLKSFDDKSTEAEQTFKSAKEDLSKCHAELVGCQSELKTAEEDFIRFEAEFNHLNEQSGENAQALLSLVGEMHGLETRMKTHQAQSEKSQLEANDVRLKQSDLNDKIAELSGGRKELSLQREQLSSALSDARLSATELKKETESLQYHISELKLRKENVGEQKSQMLLQIVNWQGLNTETKMKIEHTKENAFAKRTEADRISKSVKQLILTREDGEKRQTDLRAQIRYKSDERELAGREIAKLEEQSVSVETKTDDIIRQLYEEYELTRLDAEQFSTPIEDLNETNKQLNKFKNQIRSLGTVNVDSIEEYKEVSLRYETLSVQVEDVEKSKRELIKLIEELMVQMKDIFIDRFNQINDCFGEVFVQMFNGGKGQLSLSNPDDVLNSGIDMYVQPPGKVIANMDSLSGGEKALVAISLFFAILKVNPSPFCVLDEIEAALDDVNVDRFAKYLKTMAEKTQFIVISHRRGTMEEADVLYGVTMQEHGVSKLLELRASEIEEKLGIVN